jgi:hypothetical protein
MQLEVITSIHGNITVFRCVTPCILEVLTFRANLLRRMSIYTLDLNGRVWSKIQALIRDPTIILVICYKKW